MKNRLIFSFLLFCGLQISLHAQPVSFDALDNENTNAGTIEDYAVVARAANSRSWGAITVRTNDAGQVITATNRSYTEIAANISFQDAAGNWSDSEGGLVIVADGARSGKSPLRVHFDGDGNADGGAVRMTAPDGKVFVSKVFGISYYDPALDTNVLIATLKSTQGSLVGTNHILYQNAFDGLNADLWYTYSISGLDQDVVLHDCPPSPAVYGLNPASARLQVFTEWFDPPEPRKTAAEDDGIAHDAWLDFGSTIMGPGAALFTQGQGDPVPVESGTIYKHWGKISGRDWLVEEIRYPVIARLLQTLPLHASAQKPGRDLYKYIASTEPLRPKAGAGEAGTPILVAKSIAPQPGLVLDYTTVSTVNNYTFQCDTTYYVSANVTLGGTNTTWEGGTILKYASNVTLTVNSPVTWLGSSFRPVVMTAVNDNTMGDTVSSGSPGTTYYAATALYFNATNANTNLVLQHLRVLNAKTAVAINGQSNHLLADVQMVNCGNGLAATNTTFSLWNALMFNVMTNFTGTNSTGDVEQLTVDTANWLNTNQTLNMTNCLLVAVTNTGSFTSNAVQSTNSRSGIFQTVGDGSHYLVTNSPYTNAGTTGINPFLAAALAQMTTFPPAVFSNTTINVATNLGIQAARDSETPGPTLGYHYDPLDWVFGGTTVNTNITFAAGTGVGWFKVAGKVYGIIMSNTMIASFQGTATAPVWWVRANTVQEGGNGTIWPGAGAMAGLVGEDSQNGGSISQSAQANLLFTHCVILAKGDGGGINHFRDDVAYLVVNAEHSEFHGGICGGYVLSFYLTNCLFDRLPISQIQGWPGNAVIVTNCTWHGGDLCLTPNYTPITIIVRDCAFDESANTTSSYAANTNYANYDYNAFTNTAAEFPIGGTHDKIVTNGFNWQTGWLGNFYLPTNSPLITNGDVAANLVGLSYFTTQTNQVPESNSVVDIGYHYAAFAQSNTCVSAPGGQLAIGSQNFCIGEMVSDNATWSDNPGLVTETFLAGGVPYSTNSNVVYSTILSNWSVVNWNGIQMTNVGSGISSSNSFTPTNAGVGTNVFCYSYSDPTPCSAGPYIIAISNTFTVVGIQSLAPTNTGTCIEITNATPYTRTFLVQANPTNGSNTLAVYATPTPANAVTNLPACWSLNGALTNVVVLSISAPAVYEVVCNCGTSSLTNYIVVTTNAVTNGTVDAPCGTGPFQLGYWSFDYPLTLVDYWTGESNTLDSTGTNNGTIIGSGVTYTNGNSGPAFKFNNTTSHISFGTNAGNFGTNSFTIDFWMETQATAWEDLIGKRPICYVGNMWDVRMENNGTIFVELCQDGSGTYYTYFASTTPVNDGNFHHITISRVGDILDLYVDGALESSFGAGIVNLGNSTNLTVGLGACGDTYGGMLADIKLFEGTGDPWVSSRGWPPTACYNVQNPATLWTNGLQVDSTNAAKLAYNYLESDGTANVNSSGGVLAFWFNPDWNGGAGPGTNGYLFELGDVTAPGGGWALLTDPAGTGLSFVSGANGALTAYLTAPIGSWVSNQWHQIVLSYSSNETVLFVDGVEATNGTGLTFEPDLATRLADGFTIGSDHRGLNQARGVFDELRTYNCPADPSEEVPIVFAISVTNQFVASSTVGVNIALVSGNPTNIAVLVDSTNFYSATWTPYNSSNITVNLGSTQGLHTISVGLQGAPPVSQQAWNSTTVVLDSTTPTISITNPANNATFNASRVNIGGNFAAPSVQQITVNGLLAFINGTNFEAVNVPLSPGTNLITANLACSTSLTTAASISIITATNVDGSLNNPVQLQATPVAGFNPLAVEFLPQTNVSGVTQVFYDFIGDDIAGLATNNLNTITYTYTTNGQYYPVVTVQTPMGRFSSIGGWNAFFADPSNEPIRITVLPQPVSGSATVTNINGLVSIINITDPVALKWTAISNLYVLSGITATITEFDTNGNIVRALSGIGPSPTGLDVDAAGNVYVAMNGANQVWRFNPTASSFAADTNFGTNGSGYIGGSGTNAGQFNAPFGVAISADGTVISLTDSGNNRVQQFDTRGNFHNIFGSQGSGLGQFNTPTGITYDNANDWYVLDSGNNRFAEGTFVITSDTGGTLGTGFSQFTDPLNISVGDRGVYVADTGNNRIQAFDKASDQENGRFNFGPTTVRYAISSGLNHPAAVAAVNNPTNDMFYIADTGNNRVILYAVEADNPAITWNNMISRVQAGDILGAISFFSAAMAQDYEHDFFAIGLPSLLPAMNAIGPLTPSCIYSDTAQYYFIRNIQGINITFPVDFDKENGVWTIKQF